MHAQTCTQIHTPCSHPGCRGPIHRICGRLHHLHALTRTDNTPTHPQEKALSPAHMHWPAACSPSARGSPSGRGPWPPPSCSPCSWAPGRPRVQAGVSRDVWAQQYLFEPKSAKGFGLECACVYVYMIFVINKTYLIDTCMMELLKCADQLRVGRCLSTGCVRTVNCVTTAMLPPPPPAICAPKVTKM